MHSDHSVCVFSLCTVRYALSMNDNISRHRSTRFGAIIFAFCRNAVKTENGHMIGENGRENKIKTVHLAHENTPFDGINSDLLKNKFVIVCVASFFFIFAKKIQQLFEHSNGFRKKRGQLVNDQ